MSATTFDRFDPVIETPFDPVPARLPAAVTSRPGRRADAPGEVDWMRRARCRDFPEVDFHPTHGDGVLYAIAVCNLCPVRGLCLDYALCHNEEHGVWGGYSERGRRQLRRVRRASRG